MFNLDGRGIRIGNLTCPIYRVYTLLEALHAPVAQLDRAAVF